MVKRSSRGRLQRIGEAGGRPIFYDEDQRTYHLWFDEQAYEPVSTTVLFGVSKVTDTPVDELETLSARIDPEALDALFDDPKRREGAATRSVSFSFAGCSITVYGDGEISIDPR